ncbi:hypothetical protein CkaCkLH20_11685 [Colletotrichum karsti]|uniref:Amidase domain-containing protein n=1 Tax=Colletotrichum karsti TaxID=1095194 RepID=A0A9P6HYN7_9PEZI|nr:uncharacterized protein CkaCkLH20_11685 [Colletotrichum karsti]KAF9870786.1 hypothetical protein CkaCkLH20_11685 [Colletotrichum karsti]
MAIFSRKTEALCLGFISLTQAAALLPHSYFWEENGTHYWSSRDGGDSVSLGIKAGRNQTIATSTSKCTVFTGNDSIPITSNLLSSFIDSYGSTDDVWSDSFLDCIVIQGGAIGSISDFVVGNNVTTVLTDRVSNVQLPQSVAFYTIQGSTERSLSNGPYDTSLSFMSGSLLLNASSDSYIATHFGIPCALQQGIAVPSRLSSLPATKDGPLAGLRFAVKDVIDVKGMKTSGGCRAYYQTYGPRDASADAVSEFVRGGAKLVGKLRTTAFAQTTPVNGGEIDYQDPWNPRGDGYQTTGGSSSGSGSAVSSYDWIDFALGSDTGGSVRFPARFAGLYGYKPTWGVHSMKGVFNGVSELDTVGFLARSPSTFITLARYWARGTSLDTLAASVLPPTLTYWADEPALEQAEAEKLKQDFFAKVVALTGLQTTSVNVTEKWRAYTGLEGELESHTGDVGGLMGPVQFWDTVGADLVEKYGEANDGAWPPSDATVQEFMAKGSDATTRGLYPEYDRRRRLFAEFWNTQVSRRALNGSDTCGERIIMHSTHVAPLQEKVKASVSHPNPETNIYQNIAGTPEIVVPIGQVTYFSPYTRKDEKIPVTVSFAGAKGCDLQLFALLEKLMHAGLVKEVLAGKLAYPLE